MLARMECKTDIIEDPFIAARMGKRDVGKADFQRFFLRKFRPERQRVAITLRVFEDLSFKEIAQIMSCPYDTAKANYRHALLKLREIFEAELNRGGELENWNSLFSTDGDAGWDASQSVALDHQEVEQ